MVNGVRAPNPAQVIYDRAVLEEAQDLFTADGGVGWDDLPHDRQQHYIDRAHRTVRENLAKAGIV